MRRATVLVAGLACVVLSGFSARVNRSGEGARRGAHVTAKTIVAREWKGRVAPPRADEYYKYLLDGVAKMRAVPGSLGVEVMRRNEPDAVGFTVISYWESREAIKAFAGEDIEKPHHLPRDREMLLELPTRVLHYDVTFSDLARVRVGGEP